MNISAWHRVFAYFPMRLIMKVLALVAYPLINKQTNPVWGVNDATDFSYWNIAVRNGAHNFTNRPAVEYTQTGNKLAQEDWTLEKRDGFQWRRRESLNGKYVSFRCTWGKRRNKGKKELYIGWTMNETPYFRLTFQPRIF